MSLAKKMGFTLKNYLHKSTSVETSKPYIRCEKMGSVKSEKLEPTLPRPATLLQRILRSWIYLAAGAIMILIILLFIVILVIFYGHYTIQSRHYNNLNPASGIYPHNPTHILSPLRGERLRFAEQNLQRQTFVRDLIQDSGRRVIESPDNANKHGLLLTALSTLLVVGLREEFVQSRDYVMSMNINQTMRNGGLSELVVEDIGGLLACYAITGDRAFSDRARDLVDALAPAYATPTGLPLVYISLRNGSTARTSLWLTEAGGDQMLEYAYLSHLYPNDTQLKNRATKMRTALLNLKPDVPGLYLSKINAITGEWANDISTHGRYGRQFFSWLAKANVQVNGSEPEAANAWHQAMAALIEHQVEQSTNGTHLYVQDVEFFRDRKTRIESRGPYMNYYACALGATLAIGIQGANQSLDERESYLKLADQITQTCRDASNGTRSGLAPNKFYFDSEDEATNSKNPMDIDEMGNFLNPELAESYFILWRTTHEQKYRDYAWEMSRALYAHCHAQNGTCASLMNVNLRVGDRFPGQEQLVDYFGSQPAHLLGGTLKYLYLIFAEDDVLPLDKWIFNSLGQPLPIFNN